MKKFYTAASAALVILAGSFSTANAQNISCGNKGNKVLVCHIPPGNPANAHTICISPNAVQAHVPGNNQHNDFLGDCWAGCVGMEVISATQGKRSDGSDVLADRSHESAMLGTPDGVNAPGGFYALGFGGEVIIKMDGGILNRPGNDLKLYETSFGQPACDAYPEYADIYVSTDMVSWTQVATVCQDGEFDIAPLDYIMFVKIVDASTASDFGGIVDGYDIDGIQCINTVAARLSADNASIEEEHDIEMHVYPNPINDEFSIQIEGFEKGTSLDVELIDAMGRVISFEKVTVSGDDFIKQISASDLSAGVYTLRVTGNEVSMHKQVVKK
ncbi:MAG: T9SS type A sorting domain-containing protein [Bacteroidia bacterium]